MGATCELQQIEQAVAEEYLRRPALLIDARRLEHEKFTKEWHIDFAFSQHYEAKRARSYDWEVLVRGLVSLDEIAYSLVVHGGQPVGGLEESWQMGGEANILNSKQVTTLHNALVSVRLGSVEEHFDGHALMFQDFQRFLKESAETNKASLLFVGP